MRIMQRNFQMKLRRWVVTVVGVACLSMSQLSLAATCEGSRIAIVPNAEKLPSVESKTAAGNTGTQAGGKGGKKVASDAGKNLARLKKRASGGSSQAQYLLGTYYFQQAASTGDYKEAAYWIKRSVAHGCTPALLYLGLLTQHGLGGVPKDIEKGTRMITTAAKAGDPEAQWWWGGSLITGAGTHKDPKVGFAWIKRAANAGYPAAELALANLYLVGKGTPKNPTAARTLLESIYKKKGDSGPIAAYFLGWMYMNGTGVPVNVVKAFKWMLIASDAHVAHSAQLLKQLTAKLPKQKLRTACSVHVDPLFTTDEAKEYAHAKAGETVAILGRGKRSYEVYIPGRLVGYIPPECLGRQEAR